MTEALNHTNNALAIILEEVPEAKAYHSRVMQAVSQQHERLVRETM